ncbi:PTS sugar transporter subunit IIB [Miniphocaeibacter halophilus]|uniref:PTS sugar transporter subunit IIB n=1 Tax=Miniphocaeibacter halophilus TaxID=2931922 RepID=A0AC61MT16_9FIRM|nr:PTS sugar transporter subunit IIB [Miniphocaeibacter halophilus]QQK08737.1 PTS sugar transporter subunit IIB [Miniphocaeibacter halophilus]
MIKLLRVDHRLLHGQVAFSWTNSIGADCILVASDKVVKDEIWKTTLRLGKPAGVKLVIKGIQDSIDSINQGKTDKYKLLIVVQTIEDAEKIARNCPVIKSINLGGVKHVEGSEQIGKSVYLTEEDKRIIRKLIKDGYEVEMRQLADDSKKNVANLI